MNLVGGAPVAREKKSGSFNHKPTWYEKPIGERPPADTDDWDIPDQEISRLQMLFPNAVRRVPTS